jgi:predicted Zn-dependent peptidase
MYYQPQNAIIVVAGDIKPEAVFASAQKEFGEIKNSEMPTKKHMVEPVQDGAKRIEIAKESEVEIVAIAYHIPNFQHKDQIALSALSELLSSGKSSRLNSVLIDEKKLVNSIYAYNMENKDPGIYLFMAICNPGVKAEVVEEELLKQIELIKTEEVSKAELEKVKLNTKSDFIFSMENSSSLVSLYGSYFARGDIKPLLEYEKNLIATTPKDIKEVANRYFTKKNSTTVILRKEIK